MDESMHYNEIIKHNEVNFRLSQEILWPRFDGNESGQLTETLKVCTGGEHGWLSQLSLNLSGHDPRVMGSRPLSASTLSVKPAKNSLSSLSLSLSLPTHHVILLVHALKNI